MKEISKIAAQIEPSSTLRVDALYKQMRAEGEDIIGFGAGEPDFDTPANIRQAAFEAIGKNKTGYTPAGGLPALRKAIAGRFHADYDIHYEPEQIVVASGAKHSIYIALQAIINPGDEVILPSPYWVSYAVMIKMAGGIPIVIPSSEQNNFKISGAELEAAVTDKTKMFVLCNPSNPTGMLYCADELKPLVNICDKHDLYILSDEIYSRLVYDGKRFTSVAALGENIKDRTILVNGVSKAYAMTGWRIGYTASNRYIAKVMDSYLSHSTSAPSTISQYAALEACQGPQESVASMRNVFQQRRDYIVSRINKMKNVSCKVPDGAFYIMLNITGVIGRKLGGKVINGSDDFALAFLQHGKVATVPCTDFGCENFIRLTYAASMEAITEGMDRLERFINGS